MAMEVDPSRRHDQAGRIHPFETVRLCLDQIAERDDPAGTDRHVGTPTRQPGPIDHGPTDDREIRIGAAGHHPKSPAAFVQKTRSIDAAGMPASRYVPSTNAGSSSGASLPHSSRSGPAIATVS